MGHSPFPTHPIHPRGSPLTWSRTSRWQPRYRCGRMRVGPLVVRGGSGCAGPGGGGGNLPSHRPGNRLENLEKPPEEEQRKVTQCFL